MHLPDKTLGLRPEVAVTNAKSIPNNTVVIETTMHHLAGRDL
jgi:hypothetical protein